MYLNFKKIIKINMEFFLIFNTVFYLNIILKDFYLYCCLNNLFFMILIKSFIILITKFNYYCKNLFMKIDLLIIIVYTGTFICN